MLRSDLAKLSIFVSLNIFLVSSALAQEVYDPEDTVYATGALFEDEARLSSKPRTPTIRAFLPEIVDLSDRFPRVGNQKSQGSCVAWAVGYAARSYYNSKPKRGRKLSSNSIPSPAYIYNSIRGPDSSCRSGTYIADALDLLKAGAVSHAEYPYNQRRCNRPSSKIKSRASRFQIEDWLMVDTNRLDQVKAELANGHPVVVGMRPNRGFHRLRGRRIWRAGQPGENDGHHAITMVGYHERGQYFKFVNSWGRGWGDRGYGRMSYDTFNKRVKYGYAMRLKDKPQPPEPKPPVPIAPDLVLPNIGCGKLSVEKKQGRLVVSGFVGKPEDLEKVEKVAAAKNVLIDIAIRPWPQCETLMTIDQPLAEADKPSIRLPNSRYAEGDTLSFDTVMAGFQGYLHVAYIQADGNVVNLVESDKLTLSTLAKNARMKFGDGLEGRPKFTISKPFGKEMIVAIASRSPLFLEDRPLMETEREFLTALRKAIIARPDATSSARHITASFVTLETAPKE